MKLYEINEEILRLTEQIAIDEETGELLCDFDSITAGIDALQMEKHSILEYLAKLVLNLRAEGTALKTEETRLKDRRSKLEKKEGRLMKILDKECGGEKTDLGVATFSYRRTSRLEVSDPIAAVDFLKYTGRDNCYRVPAPEVAKTEVKKLMAAGTQVPGCAIIEDYSCQLK